MHDTNFPIGTIKKAILLLTCLIYLPSLMHFSIMSEQMERKSAILKLQKKTTPNSKSTMQHQSW